MIVIPLLSQSVFDCSRRYVIVSVVVCDDSLCGVGCRLVSRYISELSSLAVTRLGGHWIIGINSAAVNDLIEG
jgi:hypothetical protein